MAATKVRTDIFSGTLGNSTLTAGAGNVTGGPVDLSAGYGAQLDISITNGGTGPTVPAQAQIQVATDVAGTLFVNFGGPLVGPTANNGAASWSIEIPIGVNRIQVVAGSNTGQNVTIKSDISNVTGL